MRSAIAPWRALFAFAAFVAALVGALALDAHWASAIDITSPGSNTIEGQSVCSGPPTTGNLFAFNGTHFCDTSTIAQNLTIGAGGSQFNPNLTLTKNGNGYGQIYDGVSANLFLNGSSFRYQSSATVVFTVDGSGNVTPAGALKWNNATDLSETNAPRMPLNYYMAALPGTGGAKVGGYEPTVAMHVRAVHISTQTAAAGCTAQPTLGVAVNGSDQAASDVQLTNTNTIFHLTGLSVAVAAGALLQVNESSAGSGCSTQPAIINYTMELTTD